MSNKRYSRTFPYLFYYLFALIERLSDYRFLAYRGDGFSMISTNTEESRQHIKREREMTETNLPEPRSPKRCNIQRGEKNA